MALWSWSKTAATNATADTTINWAEGMAPSQVNDSARAMMARIAEYRDDVSGLLVASGTAMALTLTTNQGLGSGTPLYGQSLAFVPSATNATGVTLAVDGGAAYPINSALNVPAPAGTIIGSTPYNVRFDTANGGQWLLSGYFGNPYNIPLGGSLQYWGSSTPNSAFAFMRGSLLSRTTYATLYNLIGTTYGAGDGSTTFAIPDLRGRVAAGADDAGNSNRLTGTYFGADSHTLGAVGGAESELLTAAQIPAHTHSGTTGGMNANNPHSHTYNTFTGVTVGGGGAFGAVSATTSPQTSTTDINHAHTFTTDSGTGGGGAHPNVQPTIICNHIMRII